MTACSGSDEVMDFARDFADKASKNSLAEVRAVYPDAAKADSLALDYVADSVRVTPRGETAFDVSFGNGVTAIVEKDASGKLGVTSSKGLFAYPEADMGLARATGQWDVKLNDADNAGRMKVEGFRDFLVKREISKTAKGFKASQDFDVISEPFAGATGQVRVTVNNDLDHPIDAGDYNLYVVYEDMRVDARHTDSANGKHVGPHSSVTFDIDYSMHVYPARVYVNTTMKDEELFKKYFKAEGGEFEEFLKSSKPGAK